MRPWWFLGTAVYLGLSIWFYRLPDRWSDFYPASWCHFYGTASAVIAVLFTHRGFTG